MNKNYYVNQLDKELIKELYFRIKIVVEYKEQHIPVDYSIITPAGRFKMNNTHPYCTLFLKDFSCSLSGASEETKESIRQIYRNFMLEVFEGTDYKADATAYDENKKAKLEGKTL